MDIQQWRLRIGMFNGNVRNCRPLHRNKNTCVSLDKILYLLRFYNLVLFLFDKISDAFVFVSLFIIIISHITGLLAMHFLKKCFKSINIVCSPPIKLLFNIFTNKIIIAAFISIIIRSLLFQSGSVERNPGPPPKLFSFCNWNVDSLLARDSIKKSYIECIQSVQNVDIFSCCETYLNDKITDNELEIDGFTQFPLRADCKQEGRPRGGVCLYYKESLPLKRRNDLELISECICAEINLKRKFIYI